VKSRAASLIGSALFLLIAPGTLAGYIPWLLSRWRFEGDFGGSDALRIAGAALALLGGLALLECFLRFALVGIGTPAPVAPTRHLVVSGLYRHVRNPMYVAVASLIFGQALIFGQKDVLLYGAAVWLAFHLFVLLYEEPAMRRSFPDEYARFTAAVPRWLPRLKPWRGGNAGRHSGGRPKGPH
jgi:protein-S-isoprenylcysteine O-methyltransferase Ste14